jgi:hypothetical protein
VRQRLCQRHHPEPADTEMEWNQDVSSYPARPSLWSSPVVIALCAHAPYHSFSLRCRRQRRQIHPFSPNTVSSSKTYSSLISDPPSQVSLCLIPLSPLPMPPRLANYLRYPHVPDAKTVYDSTSPPSEIPFAELASSPPAPG